MNFIGQFIKFDESETTSEKLQSFMAFILCKIFVEEPFSIIKIWEKYWIINQNWTPTEHYIHRKLLAEESGKLEILMTKLR